MNSLSRVSYCYDLCALLVCSEKTCFLCSIVWNFLDYGLCFYFALHSATDNFYECDSAIEIVVIAKIVVFRNRCNYLTWWFPWAFRVYGLLKWYPASFPIRVFVENVDLKGQWWLICFLWLCNEMYLDILSLQMLCY